MTAVNEYVELHRVLANPLADLTRGSDPEQTARARRAHRSLIREARAVAERPKYSLRVCQSFCERRFATTWLLFRLAVKTRT